MLLRRQLWRGLLLLLGFAGLHLQGLFDHAIGEGVEVGTTEKAKSIAAQLVSGIEIR